MSTRLCVTVTAPTTAQLRARRDAAAALGQMVELRVDTLERPEIEGALQGRAGPVIVTCRPAWEGGYFRGAEEDRLRLLRRARELGAEYVDVEAAADVSQVFDRGDGRGIVLSHHDFDEIPADLEDRYDAMRRTGAEVVKIAGRARRLSDQLRFLSLAAVTGEDRKVFVAMGPAGQPSRVLAARFGSAWTYAGDDVAPGQLPAWRMARELRFGAISARTEVYGVLGRPVGHSLSPAMHNAAFAASGTDAVYLPFEGADADDFFTFANALPVAGASVTAPFKVELMRRLDRLDPLAERVGAVNTVRRIGTAWEGMNSDVAGFLAPLRERLEPRGLRVSVLGAGGAARAVLTALDSLGARVTVHARQPARAAAVAELARATVGPWPPAPGTWDVLVNTTPVGTAPIVEESPLDLAPPVGTLVYDLVYNPAETALLRQARALGCRTIGGLEMLVAQAHVQCEWWTGFHPPRTLLWEAAVQALASVGGPAAPVRATKAGSDGTA